MTSDAERRLRLVLLALVAGCAHEVTEPNPPGPPDGMGARYAGRIVLQTSALRDGVQEFRHAWTRRLTIMGVAAKITYDDDRAVVDVYGAVDLDYVSRVLTDPGGFSIDSYPIDGGVDAWFAPDVTCGCSGRVWVELPAPVMCDLQNGVHGVFRNGEIAEITTKKFWHIVPSERFFDTAPGTGCYVENQWWIHHLLVGLPPAATPQKQMEIVLALGGGRLPVVPTTVSVTRGGAL